MNDSVKLIAVFTLIIGIGFFFASMNTKIQEKTKHTLTHIGMLFFITGFFMFLSDMLFKGDKGDTGTGTTGPTGPMGPMGMRGEIGPMGPMGLQGLQGEIGPIGPMGPMGLQGLQGEIGPMGPMGMRGEIGPMGPMGLQGLQGEIGPIGPMGPMGLQGLQGEIGPMGPMGLQGLQGEIGPMGPTGPMGPRGESNLLMVSYGSDNMATVYYNDRAVSSVNDSDGWRKWTTFFIPNFIQSDKLRFDVINTSGPGGFICYINWNGQTFVSAPDSKFKLNTDGSGMPSEMVGMKNESALTTQTEWSENTPSNLGELLNNGMTFIWPSNDPVATPSGSLFFSPMF